jgi:hypothetical protein
MVSALLTLLMLTLPTRFAALAPCLALRLGLCGDGDGLAIVTEGAIEVREDAALNVSDESDCRRRRRELRIFFGCQQSGSRQGSRSQGSPARMWGSSGSSDSDKQGSSLALQHMPGGHPGRHQLPAAVMSPSKLATVDAPPRHQIADNISIDCCSSAGI